MVVDDPVMVTLFDRAVSGRSAIGDGDVESVYGVSDIIGSAGRRRRKKKEEGSRKRVTVPK
jgi:hypothetical protein